MQFFEKGVVAELRILMQIRLTMGQKLHWKKYSQSKSSLSLPSTLHTPAIVVVSRLWATLLLLSCSRLKLDYDDTS